MPVRVGLPSRAPICIVLQCCFRGGQGQHPEPLSSAYRNKNAIVPALTFFPPRAWCLSLRNNLATFSRAACLHVARPQKHSSWTCRYRINLFSLGRIVFGYCLKSHCSAIAAAIPGNVRDRSFQRSGPGDARCTRAARPSTMLVGCKGGRFFNHKQVAFVSP